MRIGIIRLIARQFLSLTLRSRAIYMLGGVLLVLIGFAVYGGVNYHEQNHARQDHQQLARESWEGNPDKHPHRMAHFGTFAFRLKHPLSVFDFGIESYTGNAVFLEAHKQNMVNFSEAGFSTGILRFGELSLAMILQLLLPLILFFLGFSSIVSDRENGTLKILLTQGASWKEILFGRSVGLFVIMVLILLPLMFLTLFLLFQEGNTSFDSLARFSIIFLAYLAYGMALCLLTIVLSASSQTSKSALLKLLGLWLVMTVFIPRVSQAVGAYLHPSPTKLEFRSAIEAEVIQYGDSHNPNDPYYNTLRDSILAVHQVASVEELPINYGGFIMSQGERISAEIYARHHAVLMDQYRKQNRFSRGLALINPYLAIKNLSMALSGTDFESYVHFQDQAETYRYQLAQHMNDLQIKYINPGRVSGSEGKSDVIERAAWKAFPDFEFQFLKLPTVMIQEWISIVSLLLWLMLSCWIVVYLSTKAKVL